jgi:hypothetical protein
MGVKSTQSLSREEAEKLYVELRMKDPDFIRQVRVEAVQMDSTSLEEALESMSDKANGGEGFKNFLITP